MAARGADRKSGRLSMLEVIQPYVISWAVTTVLVGVSGYFAGKVKHLTARDRAIEEGVRCMLRAEISRKYERYVIDQKPMTIEVRRELDEEYRAYHDGLNGNGTGQWMYEELCEVPLVMK